MIVPGIVASGYHAAGGGGGIVPVFQDSILSSGTTTNNHTFTEPAGAALNSIMVAAVYVESSAATFTPGTGWSSSFAGTALEQILTTPNGWSAHVFWIRRGASAPDLAFSWSVSAYSQCMILSYSGAKTSGDPWSFGSQTIRNDAASTNWSSVNGTTLDSNEKAIWIGMNFVGSSSITVPTGYTGQETAGGNDIYLADRTVATAGSETANGASWSGAPADNASSTLMGLRPA